MSDSPPGYFVNGYLTKLGLTSLPELSLHFLTSCFILFFFLTSTLSGKRKSWIIQKLPVQIERILFLLQRTRPMFSI